MWSCIQRSTGIHVCVYDTHRCTHHDMARLIIYTCVTMCGGLGDRINGVTTVYETSIATNRSFRIHSPFFKRVTPSRWMIERVPKCKHIDIMDRGRSGFALLTRHAKGRVKCLVVRCNQYKGNQQALLLKNIFNPVKHQPGLPEEYVAIHFRSGGYGEFKSFDPPRYNTTDIPRFMKHVLDTNHSVYVASDSTRMKRVILNSCAYHGIKCMHTDQTPKHVDRQHVTQKDHLFVWDEYFALVGARCLVYGYSGFAFTAFNWPGSLLNRNCSVYVG